MKIVLLEAGIAVAALLAVFTSSPAAALYCDTTLDNTTGTIEMVVDDPGKGKNYTWCLITGMDNATLMLDFTTLDLRGGTDNITIFTNVGVNGTNSSVVTNFMYGYQDPVMVISLGNVSQIVLLRGQTDKMAAKFTANYNMENCTKVISGSQGIIKSPTYLNGTGSFSCVYNITVPSDVPVVTFPQFNLPNGSLAIQQNQDSPIMYTGNSSLPDDFVGSSGTGNVTLTLMIQNASAPQAFVAQYQTANKDCSGSYVVDNTTQTNISLPAKTPFPIMCFMKFTAKDNGSHVYLQPFVTPTSQSSSNVDSVQIYNGAYVNHQMIGSLNQGSPWYVSSDGELTVVADLGSRAFRSVTLGYNQNKYSQLTILDSSTNPVKKVSLAGADVAGQTVSLLFLTNTTNTQLTILDSSTNPMKKVSLAGADVAGQTVSLLFLTNTTNTQIVVDAGGDKTKLTNSTLKIQDSAGNNLLTFGKDLQLFPVRVEGGRALVVIEGLNVGDAIDMKVIAVSPGDCNKLYSGDAGLIKANSSMENRTCTVAVTSAMGTMLNLNRVGLCQDQTLELYAGLQTSSPKLATLSSTSLTPSQIYFPAGAAPRLSWTDSSKSVGCLNPILTAGYWTQAQAAVCGQINPQVTSGTLRTPNYPSLYPLNLECSWRFPAQNNSLLFMTFNTLELAEKHSIKLQNSSSVLKEYNSTNANGTSLPDDMILTNSNISVAFTSKVTSGNRLEWTARGLDMKYKILTCGGVVSNVTANISSPLNVTSSVECIWIIKLAPTGANNSVNVVSLNLTAKDWVNSSSGSLTLFDGPSIREPVISLNLTKGNFTGYSRHNTMIIQYKYSLLTSDSGSDSGMTAAKPFTFKLTYNLYSCNTSNQCHNGDCMLPGWRCNGVIQCTDGSDEIGCNGSQPVTTPTPPVTTTAKPGTAEIIKKVPGYVIFICLLVGLIVGILLTVLVPRIIRKWRLRRYQPNSNYGTLHEDT